MIQPLNKTGIVWTRELFTNAANLKDTVRGRQWQISESLNNKHATLSSWVSIKEDISDLATGAIFAIPQCQV